MFVDVGACDEFEEGVARVVMASGRQLGVVRWRGEVFAVRNICPHQLGPICGGHTMPLIAPGDDGVARVHDDTLVIICPWHSWEFEARTGKATWSDRFKLKTYPAKVEGGRVLVDVGDPKIRDDETGAPSGRMARKIAQRSAA